MALESAQKSVQPATEKFSLFVLSAMVVGSMVGAGIFSLPRAFGNATGPFGAIIAWCVAGTGMYMLARVFQSLAERKPELDAGVYASRGLASAITSASCRLSAIGSAVASAMCFIGC